MGLYEVIYRFNVNLKRCHYSVTMDCITFVTEAFKSLLRGVFTTVVDILVISESINCCEFRLYTNV